MAARDTALNTVQLEVLAWVRDGCAAGVYADWSHRITARALHNRGLVRVRGHGVSWTATIEPDGLHYLVHGSYRPAPAEASAAGPVSAHQSTATLPPADPPRAAQRPVTEATTAPTAPHKAGVTETFVEELLALGAAGVEVPAEKASLFRRRAADADRDGRVPDGKRIAFRPLRDGERHAVRASMERVPRWHADALRARRRGDADLTRPARELADSESFQVTGDARDRALRLVDALVDGGEAEGMRVTAVLGARMDTDRHHRDTRRDELRFSIEPDAVSLWFAQGTVQVRHEPTARELARARRGYLFPDFDSVPDEKLTIMLEGRSGKFWAASWSDTDERRLEEHLPRIIEEILFRLDGLVAGREAEERQHDAQARDLERKRQEWDEARDRAVVEFGERFLRDEMAAQASGWHRAAELQRYADAVRRHASSLDAEARPRTVEWAEAIERQADRMNPLRDGAFAPTPPQPTREDLKPFMGGLGASRP